MPRDGRTVSGNQAVIVQSVQRRAWRARRSDQRAVASPNELPACMDSAAPDRISREKSRTCLSSCTRRKGDRSRASKSCGTTTALIYNMREPKVQMKSQLFIVHFAVTKVQKFRADTQSIQIFHSTYSYRPRALPRWSLFLETCASTSGASTFPRGNDVWPNRSTKKPRQPGRAFSKTISLRRAFATNRGAITWLAEDYRPRSSSFPNRSSWSSHPEW
jgi:hypothetical protein